MDEPRRGTQRLQIGDFELDPLAGELRHEGRKIRLGNQPLRILEMLAQRPGVVVTRSEIRESLWPDGTVVEFEHSINVAVRRLRTALGGSGGDGRDIETMRRRGYRLNMPVTTKPTVHSIAVLSLASEGAEMAFFSDRLAESITNHLASVERLRVVPRTLAMRCKANSDDLQSVGRQLGAGALVTGRVVRSRGHVVACVELVDASTVSQLWGARLRRVARNMCELRAQLAKSIFRGLLSHL